MSLFNVFDLHCDTASECKNQQKHLCGNDLQVDVSYKSRFDKWIQTFAFFIHDKFSGEAAYEELLCQYRYFMAELGQDKSVQVYKGKYIDGCCNAVLAIEGGHVLGGDLSRIPMLKDMGISFFTLVWNGDNELASGCKGSGGNLTEFGKQAISLLEQNNIIVDVSHLNEKGFYDVCSITTKPIIATHSNAYGINPHKRNLSDDQFSYIVANKGLCGINFYPLFVNGKADCLLTDLRRHIDHMLSLGGEDVIALGSDFDGAPMPSRLDHIGKLDVLYKCMCEWYNKNVVDKIFFDNAKKFIDENIVIDIK